MEEEKFLNELKELNFQDETFYINIYYSIDEKGNIILDEDGIKEEFERKLNEIKEIIENVDKEEEQKEQIVEIDGKRYKLTEVKDE